MRIATFFGLPKVVALAAVALALGGGAYAFTASNTVSQAPAGMGESGSVAWMFSKKGYIAIEKSKADEETLMTLAIEAGADDFQSDESMYEIYTPLESFESVLSAIKAKNIEMVTSEISMIPQNYIKVEGKTAQQVVKLMELFDEHDDVQHVYANFDIEESELAEAVS